MYVFNLFSQCIFSMYIFIIESKILKLQETFCFPFLKLREKCTFILQNFKVAGNILLFLKMQEKYQLFIFVLGFAKLCCIPNIIQVFIQICFYQIQDGFSSYKSCWAKLPPGRFK